jgi:hypothetical protein
VNRAERRKKRKGKKMELNVFERLLLRNIVPQIQGWNYANMKDARELIESLFTEEEETDLQFEQEDKQVKWKVKREDGSDIPQIREIKVTDGLKKKIGKFLTQLDKEERLGFEHMTLCSKFMDDNPTG